MSEDMFRTAEEDEAAVSCWPDAAPFTRFFPAASANTVQESNGVCCADRDSFQEEDRRIEDVPREKKRVLPRKGG